MNIQTGKPRNLILLDKECYKNIILCISILQS